MKNAKSYVAEKGDREHWQLGYWSSEDEPYKNYVPRYDMQTILGIRVVAKFIRSKILDLHLRMCYSVDRSVKTADFQTEKRVLEPQFRPTLLLFGLIPTTIS
jgi:hypothetical protein